MFMNEGMDTGDILLQRSFEIKHHETGGMLMERMAEIGAGLLCETLDKLENGEITPRKQNDEEATKAPMLRKEMGKINWEKTAKEIENLVYGMQPWPGAYFETEKGPVKVFELEVIEKNSGLLPGQVVDADKALTIQTSDGQVVISDLQLQGKKRMLAGDFLRGYKFEKGCKL